MNNFVSSLPKIIYILCTLNHVCSLKLEKKKIIGLKKYFNDEIFIWTAITHDL